MAERGHRYQQQHAAELQVDAEPGQRRQLDRHQQEPEYEQCVAKAVPGDTLDVNGDDQWSAG